MRFLRISPVLFIVFSMKYRVYLVVTLVCFAIELFAQAPECSFKIEGVILDSLSKEAIQGASIKIVPVSRASISDEHGHFSLAKLCSGTFSLTVSVIGYKEYRREIAISSTSELTILLQPAKLRLKEVKVRARKPVAQGASASQMITEQQLDQTKGGTLGDVLKTVPGVTTLQTGSSIAKPVLQGLHSNRLLILNNGVRQEGQQWGMEHAPEIDPFAAQSITVIKGAESVRFGPEAIGGVILVKPAPLSKVPGIKGELNLTGSTNGSAGALSGRLEGGLRKVPGLAWRIQGTGKTSGNIKTADYYLTNTGVREINFSGALGYSRKRLETDLYFSRFETELGIFAGSHIGNIEDLQAILVNGRPFDEGSFSYAISAPSQKVTHNLLKLESHFHLNSNSHIDLIYGFQQNNRQEYDIRRGGRSGIPALDLTLNTQTLDLFLENDNSKGFKQIIGLNGISQVNNNVPGTLSTPLIPNYDTYNAGLYYIGRYTKGKYQMETGLRYDYKYLDALGYDRDQNLYGGTQRFNNLSANIGGVLHLSNQWSFRSNLASAWRAPVVSELFSSGLHRGSAAVEIGDATLNSEKSYKWINSLEHNSDKFDLNLSVFYNHINNYIYLRPSGELYQSISGTFPVFYYRQTDARLLGGDVGITYRITTNIHYGLKGAVVRARDITNNTYLPWIPSDRYENSLGYHWQNSRKETENYLRLSHLFVARQGRYQEGTDFAAPPSGYHLLGIQGGTQFIFGKSRLNLNASISNLANILYKDYMNRFRYYAHDQGRNLTLRAILKF
ncbi:TonB-dependent receptor [Desertivirga brevis]|uniref:TonB-dependent receptor n=1 Tax=Desertivirga brevis TaxID=2810310 RepID=UPI001A96E261|nr:TonB-dependent receptor [Pedobacter sp. SYSU D00873]